MFIQSRGVFTYGRGEYTANKNNNVKCFGFDYASVYIYKLISMCLYVRVKQNFLNLSLSLCIVYQDTYFG